MWSIYAYILQGYFTGTQTSRNLSVLGPRLMKKWEDQEKIWEDQ